MWTSFKNIGKRAIITRTIVLAIGGLLSSSILYAWYIDKRRIPRVVKQFEHGSKDLEVMNTNKTYFSRPLEEERVSKIIQPYEGGSFNLVTGEHGTGKTTLVRYVSKITGKGVVYFRVPENTTTLGRKLGGTVSYDWEDVSWWKQIREKFFSPKVQSKPNELELVLDAIHYASKIYKRKHGRPAVLVIDNMTKLAKEDIPAFRRLIEFAKYEADEGNLVVDFVASEGYTIHQLRRMSESSRLNDIIEIGDLSQDDAVQFLLQQGIEKDVNDIVYITGGRINLLQQAVSTLKNGKILSDIEKSLINTAMNELLTANLQLPDDPKKLTENQKIAWRNICLILDSPNHEILADKFFKSFGSSHTALDLLEKNVFAFHVNKNTVSLQSRPVELYVESEIGKPHSEQRQMLYRMMKEEEL